MGRAALIAVVIGLVLATLAITRGRDPVAEPPQAEVVASPGGTPVEFPPQPHRRFVFVGVPGGQFTDDELSFIAANFDYVMLAKFHGGFDIALHHEAARRITERNPAARVFVYFSTKYAFERNRWDGEPFDPAWHLRDNQGEVVYRARRADEDNPDGAPFVDLANPAYRRWALDTLGSWLEEAPYAGVYFDAAEPVGDHGEEVADWQRLLGQERIDAYNAGMRTLLADADRLVGPDREVVFNGIAPNPARGPDRNLDLLEVTDGADDERFCLDVQGRVHALDDDLALMARYPDQRLFFKTNVPDGLDPGDRERLGRFCLGSFLLGWEPGRSYFHFGDDYTADQLGADIPDVNVPLGDPADAYRSDGAVLSRSFTGGEVYVNTGVQPAEVTVPRALTQVQGGAPLARLDAGDTLTIPAEDAALLVE